MHQDPVAWRDFTVQAIVAAGTLFAVAVAVWTAVGARRDARNAHLETVDLQLTRDRERQRAELRDLAHARAMRQAVFVTLECRWGEALEEPVSTRDPYAPVVAVVSNNSMTEFRDVSVWLENDAGEVVSKAPLRFLQPEQSITTPLGTHRIGAGEFGTLGSVCMEFTDVHHDRWRLTSEGRLRLLNLRDIDVEA